MKNMMEMAGMRVPFFHFSQWKWPWLRHGFSSRWGGYSSGYLRELNMAGQEEDIVTIKKNRSLLLGEMGLINPRLITGEQVHGLGLSWADPNRGDFFRGVDGLFTSFPGTALMAFFADCVPVFFAVPDHQAAGIVHAGWRGTAAGIVRKAAEKLIDELKISPDEIFAGLGPCIGPCCYEVGPEVASSFSPEFLYTPFQGEQFFLDLLKANIFQLEDAGLPTANIEKSGLCTSCNPHLFYSHRRDRGKTGRMAGLVAII